MDSQPKTNSKLSAVIAALGACFSLIRLLPHPGGIQPVGGTALFSGAKIAGWKAYAIPTLIMLSTDFGLWCLSGFDPLYSPWHVSRVYVYAAFAIYVLIGRMIKDRGWGWILAASLLGSIQFFLLTNFFTWLFQPWEGVQDPRFLYSRDWAGLMECFAMGLPWLRADHTFDFHKFIVGDMEYSSLRWIVSDLFFTGLFFGLYAFADRTAPAEEALKPQPE